MIFWLQVSYFVVMIKNVWRRANTIHLYHVEDRSDCTNLGEFSRFAWRFTETYPNLGQRYFVSERTFDYDNVYEALGKTFSFLKISSNYITLITLIYFNTGNINGNITFYFLYKSTKTA